MIQIFGLLVHIGTIEVTFQGQGHRFGSRSQEDDSVAKVVGATSSEGVPVRSVVCKRVYVCVVQGLAVRRHNSPVRTAVVSTPLSDVMDAMIVVTAVTNSTAVMRHSLSCAVRYLSDTFHGFCNIVTLQINIQESF